jgi:hypothetical protein
MPQLKSVQDMGIRTEVAPQAPIAQDVDLSYHIFQFPRMQKKTILMKSEDAVASGALVRTRAYRPTDC